MHSNVEFGDESRQPQWRPPAGELDLDQMVRDGITTAFLVPPSLRDTTGYQRAAEFNSLRMRAARASRDFGWHDQAPKDAIDAMLDATPETLVRYPRSDAESMPADTVNALELYLMDQMRFLPPLMQDPHTKEGFSVIDSVTCLRDQIRTERFMRGVGQAVSELSQSPALPVAP